jgi:hypothetical protein
LLGASQRQKPLPVPSSYQYRKYFTANLPRRTLMAERRFAALPSLGPQKSQQISIDLILKGSREAVWRTRIIDFLGSFDESS